MRSRASAGAAAGLCPRLEEVEVDSDREGAHAGRAVAVLDEHLVALDARAETAHGAVEEVVGVAAHVEADQVAGQEPGEDLALPGQQPEYVVGGKGNVEEEGQLHIGQLAPDPHRREHQMVVVHPDHVRFAAFPDDGVAETVVDPDVGLPLPVVELRARRHGVEQRPERAVRQAVVVARDLGLGERHRLDPVRLLGARELLPFPHVEARPADPGARALAQHRLEGGDQAPGGRTSLEALRRAAERKGKTIARDDEGPIGGSRCARGGHGSRA